MRPSALVGCVLALAAGAAAAQPVVLADDFELDLFIDGGAWTGQSGFVGLQGQAAAAAHRGDSGLRNVDNSASGAALDHRYLGNDALGVSSPTAWVRLWLRFTQVQAEGDVLLLMMLRADSPGLGRQQAVSRESNGTFRFGGFTRDAGQTISAAFGPVDANWHLWELGLSGLGTAQGRRQVFIDGIEVVNMKSIDFGWAVLPDRELRLGLPWVDDPSFRGTFDVDDVRWSDQMPASIFGGFGNLPRARVGSCMVIPTSLEDSADLVGDLVSPVSDVALLELSGVPGSVHGSANCTGPSSFAIPAGSAGPFFISLLPAGPGVASIGITTGDYRPRGFDVEVDPADGGGTGGAGGSGGTGSGGSGGSSGTGTGTGGGGADAGKGPLSLAVGCGCQATPAALGLGMLLLALMLRRRTR